MFRTFGRGTAVRGWRYSFMQMTELLQWGGEQIDDAQQIWKTSGLALQEAAIVRSASTRLSRNSLLLSRGLLDFRGIDAGGWPRTRDPLLGPAAQLEGRNAGVERAALV